MADSKLAIDRQIAQINQRLKLARLGLQIERRGDRLGLRGTLPPRPQSAASKPYQQRIALKLSANPASLKQAEKQARIISGQLAAETFDWANYGDRLHQTQLPFPELMDHLDTLKAQIFQQAKTSAAIASAQTTWDTAYKPYFKKLIATLTTSPNLSIEQAIWQTTQATQPGSRGRQACCTAMSALAQLLDLTLPGDLKTLRGSYGDRKVKRRALPDDAAIVAAFHTIPNPSWQFVYGIMATYGLRNHEVFFCDYQQLAQGEPESVIRVLESTKTGDHEVWPFPEIWINTFKLHQIRLPQVNTDLKHTTLRRIGQLVTNQFRRYQLPFSPYDLRHAWAVRTIHLGLPDVVAAKMMGHSVAIHNRTYHQWITRRDQQQAVDAARARSRVHSH